MSPRHTPGRLHAFTQYAEPELRDQAGNLVAVVHRYGDDNARRLAACWNACVDVDTQTLEQNQERFSALRSERDALLRATGSVMAASGEMLEALQAVAAKLGSRPYGTGSYLPKPIRDRVFAAIAKATGQEGGAA